MGKLPGRSRGKAAAKGRAGRGTQGGKAKGGTPLRQKGDLEKRDAVSKKIRSLYAELHFFLKNRSLRTGAEGGIR